MRQLTQQEMIQRGCWYCLDIKRVRTGRDTRTHCTHEECPYHVLDKYKTYDEYIESDNSKIEALMR